MIGTLTLNIVLVIKSLNLLLSVVLSLLTINEVQALCLNKFVDFGSSESSQELLGKGMRDGLA